MSNDIIQLNKELIHRSWRCEIKNVSILVAIGVNKDEYREILGQQKS